MNAAPAFPRAGRRSHDEGVIFLSAPHREEPRILLAMRELAARSASLMFEPPSPPGTIFVLCPRGGMSTDPVLGATITFGRNLDDVDVVVAPDDDRVSRRHRMLTRGPQSWTLSNIGPFADPVAGVTNGVPRQRTGRCRRGLHPDVHP